MRSWWRFTWDLAGESKRLAADLAESRAAYTRLSNAYYAAATALERAEQRAAKLDDDLKFVLSEPCYGCETYQAERDDAILERDAARQVSMWLEQIGFAGAAGGAA